MTEKLYDRSRFRYRPYLKHLAPVIPILEGAIPRLGYSIEEECATRSPGCRQKTSSTRPSGFAR